MLRMVDSIYPAHSPSPTRCMFTGMWNTYSETEIKPHGYSYKEIAGPIHRSHTCYACAFCSCTWLTSYVCVGKGRQQARTQSIASYSMTFKLHYIIACTARARLTCLHKMIVTWLAQTGLTRWARWTGCAGSTSLQSAWPSSPSQANQPKLPTTILAHTLCTVKHWPRCLRPMEQLVSLDCQEDYQYKR